MEQQEGDSMNKAPSERLDSGGTDNVDQNPDSQADNMLILQLQDILRKALDPSVLRKSSLEPYSQCMKLISDDSDENVLAVQTEMCRSLHVLRILEKQLGYAKNGAKTVTKSLQDDLGKQKQEDVQVKLTLLDRLVGVLKEKQATEKQYGTIVQEQKQMLTRLERSRRSDHSRVSTSQAILMSMSSMGSVEKDDNEDEAARSPKALNEMPISPVLSSPPGSDFDALNEIGSDGGEFFQSDDSSDDEAEFVSPDEADKSAAKPWRNKANDDLDETEKSKTIEKNEPESNGYHRPEEAKQQKGVAAVAERDGASSSRRTAAVIPVPLNKSEGSDQDALQVAAAKDRNSPTEKSSTAASKVPPESETVTSEDLSEVLGKAQSLMGALKKSKGGWEIDRRRKDREKSVSFTEHRRPKLQEKTLSSMSVLNMIESEDWSATKSKNRQKLHQSTANSKEKKPSTLPKGLSECKTSHSLLHQIEKSDWGSSESKSSKQADLYFQQFERPLGLRSGPWKGTKAAEDHPTKTKA